MTKRAAAFTQNTRIPAKRTPSKWGVEVQSFSYPTPDFWVVVDQRASLHTQCQEGFGRRRADGSARRP